MAFQPATPRLLDLPEATVHSTFALDLLTQVAATLSADGFTEHMARIFGRDIPQSVHSALQERLIAGEIDNPAILVEDGDHLADYSNSERVIRIHSSVIDNALNDVRVAEFLDILLHEFGHHIDNALRQDFADYLGEGSTPLNPDATDEEGARFAFWMAWFGSFDSDRVRIATCRRSHADEPQAITVNWQHVRQIILKRYGNHHGNVDHAHSDKDREPFEAGEGHDGTLTHLEIEKVLQEHGFSERERKSVYFGNWLRDYSQLLDPKIVRATQMPKDFPDVLSRDALTRIVDVLSIKGFGDLRQDERNDYTVTADKLGVYRPSEHIDNPKNTDPDAPDPTTRDPDFEPTVRDGDPLLEVDYDTSMKRYIERSMDFMERELRIAMDDKFGAEGRRAFGSALHVLEDFFAHSNFVELALIKNGHQEVLPWTSPADCKAGLPLVTGMFGATDVLASLAGPLGEILFSIEDITYMPVKAGDRSPREQVLLILLEEHHNPLYLEIFQDFLTARDAWVELPFADYLQRCAAYLQGAAAVPGNAVGIIMKDVLTLFGENVDDWQTRYGQDPHENGSTDPTHSQLAKDHAQHPLHHLAGSLASDAVKRVAEAMVAYWSGGFGADPIGIARSYFKHPQDSRWQDAQVNAWAQANPEQVRRSTSKTEFLEIHQQLAQARDNALEQMRKDSVAYLNFMRGEFLDKDSPLWDLVQFTPGGGGLYALLQFLGIIK